MEELQYISWDIWLHASGLLLWCATIVYLKKRGMSKQEAPDEDLSGPLRDFKTEVYGQLIKQQAEKALERLSHALTTEQKALRQLIANTAAKGLVSPSDDPLPRPFPDHPMESRNGDPMAKAPIDGTPYEEAARLLELGFGEREIAKRVSIPRSQISLIARLKKYGQISHKKGA